MRIAILDKKGKVENIAILEEKVQLLGINFVVLKDDEFVDTGDIYEPPKPIPSEQRKIAYETMTHKEDGTPLALYKGEPRTVNWLTCEYNLYVANMTEKAMLIKAELSELITQGYAYINELYPDEQPNTKTN